jgi:hypothetical protein
VKRRLVIAAQAWIHHGPMDLLEDSIRQRIGFERSLARVGDLIGEEGVAYAVLVATVGSRAEADALSQRITRDDGPDSRITEWEWDGAPRFDVYLTGFETMAAAGQATKPLVEAGFLPRVVALPPPESEDGDNGQGP